MGSRITIVEAKGKNICVAAAASSRQEALLHVICIICQNKHNTQRNTKCCFWYMRPTLRMGNLATLYHKHTDTHKDIQSAENSLFFVLLLWTSTKYMQIEYEEKTK